ncbi:probable tRNA methyltransferase 9B [Hippoglossus hippoglossus]|uniref:probable tRNA methyltransferase 9B n=1 Tax=Hippoglossus hippoglossus TaxID=8267 RepID=UPI00148C9463|nr:probable tRNA methyltransferase 9B [Hippoglossus hippoglossus]
MMEEAASQLEREHVHSVYDKIAPYFNDSRYKAWPKVRQFLLDLQPGSIVADIGCGNGKYLHINQEVFKLGCDVCRPLVDSAWSQGHEVQMCDGLHLPYRDGCFDAVLSIAVIHHLSTKERRIRAIREMARTLRVGGRIMIYVWAMEQKRRKFEKQDIFVPWNPNPHSALNREHAKSRRRATAQSVSEAIDNTDKHRKVRSTSSVADEEDLTSATPQQRTQRLWFFSRSLDSVFDFGSLTLSRSSSRELSTLSSPTGESEGSKASQRGRGRGLIKQVSNFFYPSSVIGSEEDVFDSVTDLHKGPHDRGGNNNNAPSNDGPDNQSVSLSLAQECGSLALPDLVPFQREHLKQPGGESEGGPAGKERQESTQSPQGSEGQVEGSCLRYYHVFREGELAALIEKHVEELHVTHTYFDHANWCVVAEKVQLWKI